MSSGGRLTAMAVAPRSVWLVPAAAPQPISYANRTEPQNSVEVRLRQTETLRLPRARAAVRFRCIQVDRGALRSHHALKSADTMSKNKA